MAEIERVVYDSKNKTFSNTTVVYENALKNEKKLYCQICGERNDNPCMVPLRAFTVFILDAENCASFNRSLRPNKQTYFSLMHLYAKTLPQKEDSLKEEYELQQTKLQEIGQKIKDIKSLTSKINKYPVQ